MHKLAYCGCQLVSSLFWGGGGGGICVLWNKSATTLMRPNMGLKFYSSLKQNHMIKIQKLLECLSYHEQSRSTAPMKGCLTM